MPETQSPTVHFVLWTDPFGAVLSMQLGEEEPVKARMTTAQIQQLIAGLQDLLRERRRQRERHQ